MARVSLQKRINKARYTMLALVQILNELDSKGKIESDQLYNLEYYLEEFEDYFKQNLVRLLKED